MIPSIKLACTPCGHSSSSGLHAIGGKFISEPNGAFGFGPSMGKPAWQSLNSEEIWAMGVRFWLHCFLALCCLAGISGCASMPKLTVGDLY